MSDIRYVYIFSIIGLSILLVACINFINLATARSAERFKGNWCAQSNGGIQNQSHFTIYHGIDAHCPGRFRACCSTRHRTDSRPQFFTDKKLSLLLLLDTPFLIGFLVIIVAVGLISGSYPAFVLSSQEAVTVLKSNTGKFSGQCDSCERPWWCFNLLYR